MRTEEAGCGEDEFADKGHSIVEKIYAHADRAGEHVRAGLDGGLRQGDVAGLDMSLRHKHVANLALIAFILLLQRFRKTSR